MWTLPENVLYAIAQDQTYLMNVIDVTTLGYVADVLHGCKRRARRESAQSAVNVPHGVIICQLLLKTQRKQEFIIVKKLEYSHGGSC